MIRICIGVLASAALWAQSADVQRPKKIQVVGGPGMVYERMSVESIKGAPYSATTATDSVQTLADGNRITNRQSGRVYRDSEGRTRHEQEIRQVGQWVSPDDGFSLVMIDDPVARQHITLDSRRKTAVRMAIPEPGAAPNAVFFTRRDAPPSAGEAISIETEQVIVPGPGAGPKKNVMVWKSEGGMPAQFAASSPDTKAQSLGKQMMEGVQVEGTRETVSIPAGQMGNEKPIEIVTERWFSPELKIDVLRKHADPRFGETTYRVTGISRSEPSRILFEVPPDYKVEEPSVKVFTNK